MYHIVCTTWYKKGENMEWWKILLIVIAVIVIAYLKISFFKQMKRKKEMKSKIHDESD